MIVSKYHNACPVCSAINSYDIISTQLYDNDLHITCSCQECNATYTDCFMLVYNGGYINGQEYDRDNILLG